MSKTTEKISMTLTREVLDRYDQLGDAINLSRPKTLEALLDCYEEFYGDPNGAKTIKLVSYFDSIFLPKKGPYPLEFRGKALYEPTDWTSSSFTDVQIKEILETVHKAPFTVNSGEYPVLHKLNLYYNSDKQNYYVQECMSVSEVFMYKEYDSYPERRCRPLFTLKRVQPVSSIVDVVHCFGKYSSMDELETINKYIHNENLRDYSYLEEFF